MNWPVYLISIGLGYFAATWVYVHEDSARIGAQRQLIAATIIFSIGLGMLIK